MPRSFVPGLLVTLLSACGGSGSGLVQDEVAAEALGSAALATLQSSSFVAETKVTGSPLLAQELTRTYAAPDRLRLVSSVGGESILIGGTAYFPFPNRPGYYEAHAMDDRSTVEDFFPHLAELLRAEEVVSSGDSFTFALRSGRGGAEIVDGRVVALTVHEVIEGEETTAAYAFSMFDKAPAVEPPPDDRILLHESLPPCDEATPIADVGGEPIAVICDPGA